MLVKMRLYGTIADANDMSIISIPRREMTETGLAFLTTFLFAASPRLITCDGLIEAIMQEKSRSTQRTDNDCLERISTSAEVSGQSIKLLLIHGR